MDCLRRRGSIIEGTLGQVGSFPLSAPRLTSRSSSGEDRRFAGAWLDPTWRHFRVCGQLDEPEP
jgi:hypothetical protein